MTIATPLGKDNPALAWPDVDCCTASRRALGCVCGVTERVLRAYASLRCTVPMTADQRAWCIDQVRQVEGQSASNYDMDEELARMVLAAWLDYARDKGAL